MSVIFLLLHYAIQIFFYLVLVEVIGSWVVALGVRLPEWGYNILSAVQSLTSPLLGPIRRFMPNMGGLDFSPLIALLLLQLIDQVIVSAANGRF